jgi:hypothetical protein
VTREYDWRALGLNIPHTIFDWTQDHVWEQSSDSLFLSLDAHQGKLLLIDL